MRQTLLPGHFSCPQMKFVLSCVASTFGNSQNLKSHWKVSMAAIAVRADRLNLITPYQKKMFWIEMSKLGYRKWEPNEPPKEFPKLLRQMVSFHMKKLGYSPKEMSDLLHLTAPEFGQMYAVEFVGPAPRSDTRHLRIVT